MKNTQEAPFPEKLEEYVRALRYRPGWEFGLENLDRGQGSKGLTLVITTLGYNSYHPERGQTYRVNHYMPVPPANYNDESWLHWLFEQCLLVERHEAMEFFSLKPMAQGEHIERPYAPNHGPGWDPYIVTVETSSLARATKFTGEINPT